MEIPGSPQPMLTMLTGGYRRTPVMQTGADIYCDSQCIIHELDRRFPTPSVFPTGNKGLLWTLSRWADGAFFDLAMKIVLGAAGEALPRDFAEDRGRLYFGSDWADALKAANSNLPHLVAQARAPLSWLDQQLNDGRRLLTGDQPAAIDAQFYCVIWFLRGRWASDPAFLSEFSNITSWEENVCGLGHGTSQDMNDEAAIKIANDCTPISIPESADQNDPQGLKPGMPVIVSPDVDGGEQPVHGTVVTADTETMVLKRTEVGAGNLHVHFPRAGYRVTPQS